MEEEGEEIRAEDDGSWSTGCVSACKGALFGNTVAVGDTVSVFNRGADVGTDLDLPFGSLGSFGSVALSLAASDSNAVCSSMSARANHLVSRSGVSSMSVSAIAASTAGAGRDVEATPASSNDMRSVSRLSTLARSAARRSRMCRQAGSVWEKEAEANDPPSNGCCTLETECGAVSVGSAVNGVSDLRG